MNIIQIRVSYNITNHGRLVLILYLTFSVNLVSANEQRCLIVLAMRLVTLNGNRQLI